MLCQYTLASKIIWNTERDIRERFYRPPAEVGKIGRGTIPTVFLNFIYRFRSPKMLKYVKKFENKRPVECVAYEASELS